MADIYIGNVRDPKALLFGEQSLTDDNIKQVFKNLSLFDKVYPVGSIYMSVNDVSPAELFGGNWVEIKDCFLLASGDVYTNGTTGGSADAVVVEHYGHHTSYWGGDGLSDYHLPSSVMTVGGASNGWKIEGGEAFPLDIAKGEDGTGKNMPPYLTVNVWKRVADKVV